MTDARYNLIAQIARKRERQNELDREFARSEHHNNITTSMYDVRVRFRRNNHLSCQMFRERKTIDDVRLDFDHK